MGFAKAPSRQDRLVYAAAAVLLAYPDEEQARNLALVEEALAESGALPRFQPTLDHLRSLPLMEAQSFHVQEFDLSRRHALHLSYWTDGDTRRRGEVLAAIKQTYRDSELLVDLNGELPDYLPMVLEFAANGAPGLGRGILNKYRASLELLRLGLERDGLPHAGVVQAICDTLGGPSPETQTEIEALYRGAPTETVGLDSFTASTPFPVGTPTVRRG
ncbi:MAG: nitrate reductase molybdenum cofactor assembly chaperone [Ruaniaceae bacterium]|nr:nitrate reductase molybdenum cofactor assembly chaperone [Ruaniaceae bacterium]